MANFISVVPSTFTQSAVVIAFVVVPSVIVNAYPGCCHPELSAVANAPRDSIAVLRDARVNTFGFLNTTVAPAITALSSKIQSLE